MKNTEIHSVMKEDGRYKISIGNEAVIADVIVLAVPNTTVQKVLADEQLEVNLKRFTTASAITLYLGFDVPDRVLPADGTGFIVSHNSDLVCDASTWTSRKWKHTSHDGNLLVRLFYKNVNPRYEELAAMTDQELLEVARNDVKVSLGIDDEPTVVNVAKWIDQMPRYDLAHNEALSVLVKDLEENYPNLLLAGCSYFGVGIGACIQNGKKTAERVLAALQ